MLHVLLIVVLVEDELGVEQKSGEYKIILGRTCSTLRILLTLDLGDTV